MLYTQCEILHGVVANVLDCEFELKSHYCIHFWTNTLGKDIPPSFGLNSIPLSYELNSTTTVLQGWLWHQISLNIWYAIKQRN